MKSDAEKDQEFERERERIRALRDAMIEAAKKVHDAALDYNYLDVIGACRQAEKAATDFGKAFEARINAIMSE